MIIVGECFFLDKVLQLLILKLQWHRWSISCRVMIDVYYMEVSHSSVVCVSGFSFSVIDFFVAPRSLVSISDDIIIAHTKTKKITHREMASTVQDK